MLNLSSTLAYVNTSIWRKISSGTETAQQSGTTDGDAIGAFSVLIRDVDTTTPINAFEYSDNLPALSHDTPLIATNAANCLILFGAIINGTQKNPSGPPGTVLLEQPWTGDSVTMLLAWTIKETTGDVDPVTFALNGSSSIGAVTFAMAINPAVPASAIVPGFPAGSVADFVFPARGLNTNSYYATGGLQTITDLTTINSLPVIGLTPTAILNGSGDGQVFGMGINCASTANNNTIHASVYAFYSTDLTSTPLLALSLKIERGDYFSGMGDMASGGGLVAGVRTNNGAGGNAYRVFMISALNSIPNALIQHTCVIDLSDTGRQFGSDILNGGSFDLSDVTAIVVGIHKISGTKVSPVFSEFTALRPAVMVGGRASKPLKTVGFVEAIYTHRIRTITNQSGASDTQFTSMQSVQIGDGSSETYFSDTFASFGVVPSASDLLNRQQYQVDAGNAKFLIHTSAACTVDLTNYTVQDAPFEMNAGCSASATYVLSGLKVINSTSVVLQDVFAGTESDATFTNCGEITHNGADLSGGHTFNGSYVTITGITQAALQTALNNFANCVFRNSAAAITVSYTGTGDISLTFSGMTFSGNTADIFYTSTSASTLTAVMSDSDATTSDTGGLAVAVTISNDVIFTINISPTGAELTLLATGTQTEYLHTETASTSNDYTFTAPLATAVDIQVYLAGYKPYWESNRDLGSANSSLTIELVADPGSQI